ncbi:hypothetical protein [Flectobacillus major]|uniref:hypothetical protein n=1 Tax=Flectobacillus major TaxID=103 RepID=UPI001183DC54|nr:hypothetical protein [Flectobacillus major]
MKPFTSIVLSITILLGSLFPRVDTLQLAKMGELVKHYQWHCKTDKCNMSFISFLAMHYSAASKHTKTAKHSHSHLPSLDSQATHAFLPSFQYITIIFRPIIKAFPEPNFVWQNFYNFLLAKSFLNPPRY